MRQIDIPVKTMIKSLILLIVISSVAVILAHKTGAASAYALNGAIAQDPTVANAGAKDFTFGFKVGMKKDQIVAIVGAKALTKVEEDEYEFSTAPTPNPDFEVFFCTISPKKGLLSVAAISKVIETNNFGRAVKDKFYQINAEVSKEYEKQEPASNIFDRLEDGCSVGCEDRSTPNDPDWMIELMKRRRGLRTYWSLGPEPNHITKVDLEAHARSTEKGYLSLVFYFEGWDEYCRTRACGPVESCGK